MSGETEQNVSGWTTDTLRMYFEQRLSDLDKNLEERYEIQTKFLDERYDTQTKAVDKAFAAADLAVQAALKAAEKAVSKSEVAADKRFESVNEFRQTLTDQTNTFITKAEAEGQTLRNTERIQDLTDRFNKLEGRGVGLNAGWVYLLGGLAALGTIVSLILVILSLK